MKNKIRIACAAVTAFVVTLSGIAQAKPERFQLKKSDRRAKEILAKEQLRNADLRNIEDPEARKAIQGILTYLNLSSKK